MNTIFVVMGLNGECSNRNIWPMRAFINEEQAKDMVSKLLEMNKSNYNGTHYYYTSVELLK